MQYLDVAAAAAPNAMSLNHFLGSLRPEVVVRQASVDLQAGDRIEGAAHSQLGILAESSGAESDQTSRSLAIDSVVRALLSRSAQDGDGGACGSGGSAVMHLSEALNAASDQVKASESKRSPAHSLAAVSIAWPNVMVAASGDFLVTALDKRGHELFSLQGLADADRLRSGAVELPEDAVLVLGSTALQSAEAKSLVVDTCRKASEESSAGMAESIIAACVGQGLSEAAVIVAKLSEGVSPIETAEAESVSPTQSTESRENPGPVVTAPTITGSSSAE